MRLLQATKHLADMASNMPRLKAFVHVSTAYVNGNQAKGSTVPEQLIPLQDDQGQVVDHNALVTSLQLMPREEASTQVCFACLARKAKLLITMHCVQLAAHAQGNASTQVSFACPASRLPIMSTAYLDAVQLSSLSNCCTEIPRQFSAAPGTCCALRNSYFFTFVACLHKQTLSGLS